MFGEASVRGGERGSIMELPVSRGWRTKEIRGSYEEAKGVCHYVCLIQFLVQSEGLELTQHLKASNPGGKERSKDVLGFAKTESAFLSGQESTLIISTVKN